MSQKKESASVTTPSAPKTSQTAPNVTPHPGAVKPPRRPFPRHRLCDLAELLGLALLEVAA